MRKLMVVLGLVTLLALAYYAGLNNGASATHAEYRDQLDIQFDGYVPSDWYLHYGK